MELAFWIIVGSFSLAAALLFALLWCILRTTGPFRWRESDPPFDYGGRCQASRYYSQGVTCPCGQDPARCPRLK